MDKFYYVKVGKKSYLKYWNGFNCVLRQRKPFYFLEESAAIKVMEAYKKNFPYSKVKLICTSDPNIKELYEMVCREVSERLSELPLCYEI